MKTISSIFIFSFLAGHLFSQITITENDLPQGGYTYLVSTDTTPSILVGAASASAQSWNFTSLSEDYPSVPTYGFTSWTSFAAAYPASNIYTYGPAALYSSLAGGAPVGTQGMNKGYMFWRTDYNGFHIIGFRADSGTYSNVNVLDNPTELLIGTPATYGSSFSNTGRWVFPMNLNPADYDTFYVSRITKTLTSDAWGDITTPAGNFPSVLRIHEYYIKTDSVYIRFNNNPVYSMEFLRDTANNYLFMANGVHYPVSIVHADAYNTVKSVEYYMGVIASAENLPVENGTPAVFPNPFRTSCIIEIPKDFPEGESIRMTVMDATGRIVSENEYPSCTQINFEKNNLQSGLFIFSIRNKNGKTLCGKLNITE